MREHEIVEALAAVIKLADLLPRGNTNFAKDSVTDFWTNELANMELDRVRETCLVLARTRDWFPSFSEFLAAYDGVAAPCADIGIEIVGKIMRATRLYSGLWDVEQERPRDMDERLDKARAFIGEAGWNFIQDKGGWWDFCNNHAEASDFERANWAKAISVSYRQQRAFGPNAPAIGIPSPVPELKGPSIARQYLDAAKVSDKTLSIVPPPSPKAEPGKLSSLIADLKAGRKPA
jgi:hypothetical protein